MHWISCQKPAGRDTGSKFYQFDILNSGYEDVKVRREQISRCTIFVLCATLAIRGFSRAQRALSRTGLRIIFILRVPRAQIRQFTFFLCELSIPLPSLVTRGFLPRAMRTPRPRVILNKDSKRL